MHFLQKCLYGHNPYFSTLIFAMVQLQWFVGTLKRHNHYFSRILFAIKEAVEGSPIELESLSLF